jgi:hypothetical protein
VGYSFVVIQGHILINVYVCTAIDKLVTCEGVSAECNKFCLHKLLTEE